VSQFPKQIGSTFTETETMATINRDGDRTITVSAVYRFDERFESRETVQLDVETAAYLVVQLKEAIDAHLVDSLTPKPVNEVF
jgi:hypothetical protein